MRRVSSGAANSRLPSSIAVPRSLHDGAVFPTRADGALTACRLETSLYMTAR